MLDIAQREPLRPVRSHHREAEAAGAARAALHRARAHRRARQGAARARRGGGARSSRRARGAAASRASRSPSCTPTSIPAHERRTARDPEARRCPASGVTLSSRGLPGDPRIRAHLDGGGQRLCAAADGRLSRAHGRGAAGRAVPRRDLSRDLGRRRSPRSRRRGAFRCAWSNRARPAARSSRRRSRRARGESKVLSFDMGGTTAKICLIENYEPNSARVFEVDRAARFLKGSGLPVRIPVIEMVEIGAGGGSIAQVDALKRVTVGPESAGVRAGPGLLRPRRHAPDRDRCRCRARHDRSRRLSRAARSRSIPTWRKRRCWRDVGEPLGLSAETAAYAVHEMVCENMASAARVHAVERGEVVDRAHADRLRRRGAAACGARRREARRLRA